MDEYSELEQCFDWVRRGGWTWFVTLKYPRVESPKYKWRRESSSKDAFTVWIDEIQSTYGEKSSISWVRAIERRETGDILFHVLLRDVPEKWRRDWRRRWYEISAGAAWDRVFDKEIERLFKFFFYKARCDIECCFGGNLTVCNADACPYLWCVRGGG